MSFLESLMKGMRQKANSAFFFKKGEDQKCEIKKKGGDAEGHGWCVFLRERELLSRIVGDPTVGSR